MTAGRRPARAGPRCERIQQLSPEEVTFLVKDLSGVLVEVTRAEYEEGINQGRHYAEMLPEEEYRPTAEALHLFEHALNRSARRLALAVGITTEKVLSCQGPAPILVSLCQTGTPIGVLMRRWAAWRHGVALPHYTISVVRVTASTTMRCPTYLTATMSRRSSSSTAGPARAPSLVSSPRPYNRQRRHGTAPPNSLAVLVDPGDCAAIAGTADDFLVPNACLNATVSGLVSRTVVIPELVGPDEFHGAKYYPDMGDHDLSVPFLDTVSREFPAVRHQVEAHHHERRHSGRAPSFIGECHAVPGGRIRPQRHQPCQGRRQRNSANVAAPNHPAGDHPARRRARRGGCPTACGAAFGAGRRTFRPALRLRRIHAGTTDRRIFRPSHWKAPACPKRTGNRTMTTQLYLIRHGESVANVEPIIGGMRGDAGLTDRGREQARLLQRLRSEKLHADQLYASTLPRAWETADYVARALRLRCNPRRNSTSFDPGTPTG